MLVVCEKIYNGKRSVRSYKAEGMEDARKCYETLINNAYQFINAMVGDRRICDTFRFNVKQFDFTCAYKEDIRKLYYHVQMFKS